MTTENTNQPAGAAPVAAETPAKRQKSNLPNFTNSVRKTVPKEVGVGRIGIATRTPYKDLIKVIEGQMAAIKKSGIEPDYVEGGLNLTEAAD